MWNWKKCKEDFILKGEIDKYIRNVMIPSINKIQLIKTDNDVLIN